MQYLKQRRAYLGTLRRLKLTELCSRLQNWLDSPESAPPLVAASARVSRRGEVLLNLWGKPLPIWGWPLYTDLRGKEVLVFPWVEDGQKTLVFATLDGRVWMRRFFDPEQKLFYAMGRRSFFRARIYTFHLPASRAFQFLGVELLFPRFWKVGNLVHIWAHQGDILRISWYLAAPGPTHFRRVQNDEGVLTKILVGGKLPRALLGRTSGTIDGVRLFETGRGDLRFSATAPKGKDHSLTRADAETLGVAVGSEVKVLLEDGWPVRAIGPNGAAVDYIIVRDFSGAIRRTLRRRLCGTILPEFAVIEKLPIHYDARRKEIYVYIASRKILIPRGAGGKPRLGAVMVWGHREILYVAGRETLNRHEREFARSLHFLLSRAQDPAWNDYAAGIDFLRAVRKDVNAGRMDRIGAACLATALRRILRRIWENSTPARRRDFTALSAGAFRVEWANLARQAGVQLAPQSE